MSVPRACVTHPEKAAGARLGKSAVSRYMPFCDVTLVLPRAPDQRGTDFLGSPAKISKAIDPQEVATRASSSILHEKRNGLVDITITP